MTVMARRPSSSPGPGEPGFPFGRWDRRPGRPDGTPPRLPLTVDRIVETALAVLDAEGVDAVTMRRVATELGTGPASLYAHVANRDELLARLHDRIIDTVVVPEVDGDWKDLLRAWSLAVQDVYRAHQDVAKLSFGTIPTTSAAGVDIPERLLRAMIDGGLTPQLAAWLLDRLALYIGADVYEGWIYGRQLAPPAGDGRTVEEQAREHWAHVREQFDALPAERYPTLRAHVDELMSGDGDDRFLVGVDMLLEGAEVLSRRGYQRAEDAAAVGLPAAGAPDGSAG